MDIAKFYNKYFRNNNVTTDTRNIKSGDIFIALKGDTFNGNKFAKSAIDSGAKVAVIDDPGLRNDSENIVYVPDCLDFLQQLANFHRKQLGIPIIGITGTNGKTTTKELINSVLNVKYICIATEGNLNNHIGVPLTLLSFGKDQDIGIVEMGANHIGEIAALCKISEPDSGIITNIGKAHLEGFGSFEGVIKAKSELYDFLIRRNSKIYINRKDEILTGAVGNYNNLIQYNESDIYRLEITKTHPVIQLKLSANNEAELINSNLFGEYNINNLRCAISIGLDWNLTLKEIKKGIEAYLPRNNRSESITLGSNQFIFDCYNANPSSMREAILTFTKLEAQSKILILGGMKELGKYSSQEHQDLGELIDEIGFDKVVLVGEEFKNVDVRNAIKTESVEDIPNYIDFKLLKDSAVMIKGSRANKLEKLKTIIVPSP